VVSPGCTGGEVGDAAARNIGDMAAAQRWDVARLEMWRQRGRRPVGHIPYCRQGQGSGG
jgi:hypothetical protein